MMDGLPALSPARDEMANGRGGLRTHWQDLLGTLVGLGPEALAERGTMLDRLFAEEGVTTLLPGATATAWRCDPVPLPIPAAEFAALEAGLAQRAAVIEAMLADLYGPQDLLARGVLPPALIFPNPSFLRPCHGLPQQQHLQLYAADLIRGPDGQWRVLADRTNAPHGMAYALENRRALSRIVPEIFRARHLRRMRPFFDIWQSDLQRLAPGGDGNPNLVLLSPGPRNAFWFEHVVLARELSCTLVEGGDLTARDGAVFLKTLGGLRRVDVLLRRQDGRGLDPLELDTGDALAQGVSGLLDAAREGSLVIANAPGSDMAEAPGLAGFLPAVAAHLGAGPLSLPSVPTLWLGQKGALETVAQDPSQWLLRPALDGVPPPVPLTDLTSAAREALLARAAASPFDHAASLALPPSVAPCVGPDGFEPRPIVLRLFLVRRGDGWVALQGGLARALAPADALAGRLPRQALAKDVWVATEDTGEIQGPAALAIPALPIRRPTGELPSRAADNFFWFGRYLERLEGAARLLRSVIARLERASLSPRELASLQKLAACLRVHYLVDEEGARAVGTPAFPRALLALLRPEGTLPQLTGQVGRAMELLRDRLTGEMYTASNHALRELQGALRGVPMGRSENPRALTQLSEALGGVLVFAAMVSGLAAENMVQGGGRLFLDLGRRLERARAITAELAVLLAEPMATSQPARLEPGLRLALELRDSVITYRNRYVTALQPAPVLDLVLAEEGNPRGLAFQLLAMRDALASLGGDGESGMPIAIGAVLAETRAMAGEVAAAARQTEAAIALPPRLLAMHESLGELSDVIARRWFALLPEAQSLGAELAAMKGAA